jgi:hypothetical protein
LSTRQFCTYFDRNYATRGLALFASMRAHLPAFRLHVLCLDAPTFELLGRIRHPELAPVPLARLEAADPELAAVKPARSTLEYYYTLTAAWPRYLLRNVAELDLLTYLDADQCFFSDPEPVFAELGEASLCLVPHRTVSGRDEAYGKYNTGWMTYRRDAAGQACLEWYREQCLAWCHERFEDGRYADQKYLEQFAARFPGVVEIAHKGLGVAFYNANRYRFSMAGPNVMVDEQPLVCYHFHSRWDEQRGKSVYLLNGRARERDGVLRRAVYAPYFARLKRIERQVRRYWPEGALDGSARQEATA